MVIIRIATKYQKGYNDGEIEQSRVICIRFYDLELKPLAALP
jgi:hypothetical protein